MLHGPVIVGTDLTASSEDALRQGARLARDLDTPLIVCHVMPELLRIGMLFPQWRGVDEGTAAAMATKAEDAVSRQLESILGDQPLSTRIVLESGTPHVGVLAQAADADAGVIVVGPGEVAAQVSRHAPVPVLVARRSPDGCVVGATDFSDPSLQTLQAAAEEARRRHVPLHLVYVLDVGIHLPGSPPVTPSYLEGLSDVALDSLDQLQAVAGERLGDLLRQFGVEGQTAVVSGHADRAIVWYAERVGAGLVVVGRHGRSGFAELTLGSTATGVIESAPCSVLVNRVDSVSSGTNHLAESDQLTVSN